MAYEIPLKRASFPAADASLATTKYLAVAVGANGEVDLVAAGGQADGISQNTGAAGEAISVEMAGISFAVVGEAVTAGDLLGANAAGKLVTPVAASGDVQFAKALEDGAGDGSVIAVTLGYYGEA